MKKGITKSYFSILIILVFNIYNLFAQTTVSWQWRHPTPTGNTLRWCQILDANTWYMAGNGGTFVKTTDGGASWYLNPSAGYSIPNHWSYNVERGYFRDKDNGVIATQVTLKKTTDGGITFDEIPGSHASWYSIYFLNNTTGYASGSNIWAKTTDGGSTWLFNTQAGGWDIYTINDTLILINSTSQGTVFRSEDGGLTWSQINTGVSVNLYRIKFLNKDTGFICGSSGTVLLTTNSGVNWITRNSGIPSIGLLDLDIVHKPDAIFVTGGDINYIYRSTDLGTTWDTVGILAPSEVNMQDYPYLAYLSADFISGDSMLVVGSYGLINTRFWKSRVCYTNLIKYGTNWDAVVWSIRALSGNGKVWAVGSYGIGANPYAGNDQIMYSSNGGNTWNIQPTEASAYQLPLYSIFMINEYTGYAAGYTGLIIKTTNGGTNWINQSSPTTSSLSNIDFINSSTGWIFGESGIIYKTTNTAENWLQQTSGTSNAIIGDMVDQNTGWFVGSGGIVSKTTDGGSNWTPQNANAGTHTLYSIKMLNANTGYLCGYTVVRKTSNGGDNWDSVQTPYSTSTYFSLDFIDANNGVVTGYGGQVMRTTNGGQSWTVYYIGTDNALYASYMVSVDTIFVGGSAAAIYKLPMGVIKVLEWSNEVPAKYVLYQNYPNPFNPSTTIKFSLPKAGNVVLRIYDITGRIVRTLLDNEQLNIGTVTLTFDGINLSSGVYFYSLLVDGKMIDSKKMVLVK
jgi:photosystem II stability/assembly factor-like uncharacterized protein